MTIILFEAEADNYFYGIAEITKSATRVAH